MQLAHRHTLIPSQLHWPTDWSILFTRSAPLIIEIGFGSASYLLDLAKSQPEQNVIGIEISLPSLRKAERKIELAGITNVRLLRSKASLAMWTLFLPGSIREIHINFPDPWSKEAHHRRRLINDRFLLLAASRMESGGALDLATDHAEYAYWIADHLERSPHFVTRLGVPFATEDRNRIRTKYEQKANEAGRLCHYFKWWRNDRPAPNEFPYPEECSMPHVILQSPLALEELEEELKPSEWSSSTIRVRLISLYRSVKGESLILDTFIKEEPLEQRLLLAIDLRSEGDVLLYLHDVGFPRPTTGIHFALLMLTEWIIDQYPNSLILRHNLRPSVIESSSNRSEIWKS